MSLAIEADRLDQAQRSLRIALVNTRFPPSFHGRDYQWELRPGRVKSSMISGAVPTLAALVSDMHDVAVFDENIEDLPVEALRGYDIVGVTGLMTQRDSMLRLLEALKGMDGIVVVGGPFVTVDEATFVDHCDVMFLGEADETWPAFIETVAAGQTPEARYEQAGKTDMSTVPTPRFDLLDASRYATAPIQFSRGCPFLCEFCDIIVIFGRRPRLKSAEQVIAELDAAVAAGFNNIFIVDDNFIGNKKAAEALLEAIVVWQKARGYPISLFTEASIDLADFPRILELMREANFRYVFVGIESPNPDSLAETRKVQNIRGDSMDDKLARIRQAGLVVIAGFIVGFDNDDNRIFETQYQFIDMNALAVSSVGLLTAIPKTPLFDRLAEENRLRLADPFCNFEPALMTRDELVDGYRHLFQRLFTVEEYFRRVTNDVDRGVDADRARDAEIAKVRADLGKGRSRLRNGARQVAESTIIATRLFRVLMKTGRVSSDLPAYWRAWRAHRRQLGNRSLTFSVFLSLCAGHWHFQRLGEEISTGAVSNAVAGGAFDAGMAIDPPKLQKSAGH